MQMMHENIINSVCAQKIPDQMEAVGEKWTIIF